MATNTVTLCFIFWLSLVVAESAVSGISKEKGYYQFNEIIRKQDSVKNVMRMKIEEEFSLRRADYPSQDFKKENRTGCSCQGYGCGCCLTLDIERISLNDTGCVNITYLPDEIGIDVQLLLDGRVIIDKKVSAKNPPPICAGIPYVKKYASLCILFHDLDIQGHQLSGCADLEAELAGVVVEKLQLGCFKIPPNSRMGGWRYGPAFKGRL